MYIADRADENKIPQLMKELKQHNVWVVPTQALAERWITSARNAESFSQDPEMKYMQPANLNNWVNAKSGMQKNEKYDPAKIVDYIKLRRKLIYECNKAGVGLLLGCDAPQVFNVPGVATHHELKYLVDAGLTPYEALKTGTVNVAKFYKKNGETGVVKKGAVSDLILINGNPLENISNTMKIEGVMLNKNWLPKAYIEQSLKKLEKSI
jgi:imidazolonepropionase-like amidohydrolase